MKRCPQCGFDRFVVTAHITQDWIVDGDEDFVDCIEECVEITHKPDDMDIWQCVACGYNDRGSAFNMKGEN